MTLQIKGFATKKAFAAHVHEHGGENVTVCDPSIFDPFIGSLAHYMSRNAAVSCVIDHPKRTKFARIIRTGEKLRVT